MTYTTFNDLTVGAYQELYKIKKQNLSKEDEAVALVSVLTGLPRWDVEDLPLPDFNKACSEITTIFSHPNMDRKVNQFLTINGEKYRVMLNAREITAGQWVDVQTFMKADNAENAQRIMIENMHKIVACICVPVNGKYDGKNHEKVSEGILELKYLEIDAICVFFSKVWNSSIKAIRDFLVKEIRKKNPQLSKMDLQNILDGSTI